jgi:transcriptional regulator with XRE-family HTH domain
MVARTALFQAPPYEVEAEIRRLGADLRSARLRRNLTIDAVADKIGIGRRAVSDAEHGKLTTTVVTYAALLWVYGLLEGLGDLADVARDKEGMTLARSSERARARSRELLDNDF